MRLFNNKISISSRITAKKHIQKIITEHLHQDAPKYDIDIDILPHINFAYYGCPGNCYCGLTFSWIVWDLSFRWESKGFPPKRDRPKRKVQTTL